VTHELALSLRTVTVAGQNGKWFMDPKKIQWRLLVTGSIRIGKAGFSEQVQLARRGGIHLYSHDFTHQAWLELRKFVVMKTRSGSRLLVHKKVRMNELTVTARPRAAMVVAPTSCVPQNILMHKWLSA
jgi:hypothetical protein